jgi:hypothetical protein
MTEDYFWKLIDQHGIIGGSLSVVVVLAAYQLVVYRDKITEAFIANLFATAHWLNEQSLRFHANYRNRIEEKISSVYTYMTMILKLAPLRVHILKHRYNQVSIKDENNKNMNAQHYHSWIIHEKVSGFEPIKGEWNGIGIATQAVQFLITETIRNDSLGLYMPNVDQMENGDLKDLMQHYGVRSFYSRFLHTKKNVVYTFLVSFNREDSIEKHDIAFMNVCAANCYRLMFE